MVDLLALLRDNSFPLKEGDRQVLEDEEIEKERAKDPLATQIWRLYARTKSQLPHKERLANLTWRMMAMNMRRNEREDETVDDEVDDPER